MKLKALIVTAAVAALTAATSMPAYALRYQDWFYAQYGTYPSENEDDWEYDLAYYEYLKYVTTDVGENEDTYYYYYDYDTSSSSSSTSSYYAYTDDPYWSGTTAKWSVEGKAKKYQVKLYRDGSCVTTKDCTGKSLSLSSSITKTGYYYFSVRAYNSYSGWSDWEDSEEKYFTASSSSSSTTNVSSVKPSGSTAGPSATVSQAQWLRATDGTGRWWYRHADGSYSKEAWESINGKWYYFDASGWMKTGWLNVGGATYYLGADGAMVTGTNMIDGKNHSFDASGRMLT